MLTMVKLFSWNIQGLNSLNKKREVLNLIKDVKLDVCILIEIEVKEGNVEDVMRKKFRGWTCINNYEHHYNGRIWILCKEEEMQMNIC